MATSPSPRAPFKETTKPQCPLNPNEAALAAGFSSYHAYLASDEWRRSPTRLAALRIAAGRCRICGDGRDSRPGFQLQVHHSCYDRVGREQHGDLLVVCDVCHSEITKMRREREALRGRDVCGTRRAGSTTGARFTARRRGAPANLSRQT